eukprot:scaffold10249_cov59-Cyclotella_meneghiniana.AAC.14
MCKTSPKSENGSLPHRIEAVNCLLGDFSSAYDEFSKRNLYANGPSIAELTEGHGNVTGHTKCMVFSVDQRTTVILTHKLQREGASSEDIQRAMYLAALSQFCIYVPSRGKSWPLRSGDLLQDTNFVKNTCTLRDFHSALRARDPLGTAWDPSDRLTPSQALLHPYFTSSESTKGDLLSDHLILSNTFSYGGSFSGPHNALESQLLEPHLEDETATVSMFTCPKCGKTYTDYNSCHQHARSRKHALFCAYDRSKLPNCINAHTMLPSHDRYVSRN